MPSFDVPGVYIEEVTGPGVIPGVSTSTTAFVGPALAGPLNVAQRITSFDDFLKIYGLLQRDGISYWPYITTPRWFYLAHGVRSFFLNGGAQAYVVRIGTAKNTTWEIDDQMPVVPPNPPEAVFRLQAKQEGPAGDNIGIQLATVHYTGKASHPTANGGVTIAAGSANVVTVDTTGTLVTVDDATPLQPNDIIVKAGATPRATITSIDYKKNQLTISSSLSLTGSNQGGNDKVQMAPIIPAQNQFRVTDTTGLFPGTVTKLQDATNHDYVVIQSVDSANFVTLQSTPARTNTYDPSSTPPPELISQEFELTITPPGGTAETWNYLSLSPLHPNYVFARVQSDVVNILPPLKPPVAAKYPDALLDTSTNGGVPSITVHGVADDPTLLVGDDYSAGLDLLRDVEDVNLLVIPDAATSDWQTIQNAMIDHCLLKGDRFAILDARPILPGLSDADEQKRIEDQRQAVQRDGGFAALYYPSLLVNDPTWKPTSTNATPATMVIPPSGAIAGVYARIDQETGVHKAPANTDVRGVVGLERRLSDRQQGPLNLKGIDVLRIFPGSGQVTVWGARTTGDPNITDWIYVNVRRLMIYIEQSIEQGIRWAVFQPNGLPLWQKLKRTINEFLTRVWRDGALFGATADKAFYVRIDEALNPPSTRALGRLYIEIGVAPVRPAEFIIVRIGLWDGGAQITEN